MVTTHIHIHTPTDDYGVPGMKKGSHKALPVGTPVRIKAPGTEHHNSWGYVHSSHPDGEHHTVSHPQWMKQPTSFPRHQLRAITESRGSKV